LKICIESTDRIVSLNGVPARVWEGATDSGIDVICFVIRIAVKADEDCSQFEKELMECRVPSVAASRLPSRMIF
jgi:hypothetical protein